jgi:hypothetical protein
MATAYRGLRPASQTVECSFGPIEWLGHVLIILLGVIQFFGYLQTADTIYDASYSELARSLLEHGSYQFDFRTATMVPPGLPVILVIAWLLFGQSQAVLYHVMALSTTLGLSASFELLRRAQGRAVALVSCLLFGSSVALFSFSTNLIFSDMPYFLASMLTLLLVFEMDRRRDSRFPKLLAVLCGLALVADVMIRSAGIVFLAAGVVWIAASFFCSPALGWRRLRLFCVPLLLGLTAQLVWTVWASRYETEEWPVAGYPHSYFAQLKVKDGNEPQRGLASLRDFPARVGRNLDSDAVELIKLLTRKTWVNPYWCSPVVAGVIALSVSGVAVSLWKGGGQLHDWYFLAYQTMYAIWPWNFEMRFLLPIVPLACLYLWRGGKVMVHLVAVRSRIAGFGFLLGGACLSMASFRWASATHLGQAMISFGVWSGVTLVGAAILVPTTFWRVLYLDAIERLLQSRSMALALRAATFLLLAVLVEKGVVEQLKAAHSNLNFDPTIGVFYPSIEAAQWIKTNAPPGAVVMARKQDLVFHYSRHQVIWFPPVTDARLLMEGLLKYQISLIVVPDRVDGYWQPSDLVCFQSLQQAYPEVFQLVHRGPEESVYEVRFSVYEGIHQRSAVL